jgi:hypothetical protein
MPGEMSLFSALQKELLEKQEELDQACGPRYAGNRATLLALITDELPRYQLYTQRVAQLALRIRGKQEALLQSVRQLDGLPLSDQDEQDTIVDHPLVLSRKSVQANPNQPSLTKSFWTSPFALLGNVFSRDPATVVSAEITATAQSPQKK